MIGRGVRYRSGGAGSSGLAKVLPIGVPAFIPESGKNPALDRANAEATPPVLPLKVFLSSKSAVRSWLRCRWKIVFEIRKR
jgi:hypothetical protein